MGAQLASALGALLLFAGFAAGQRVSHEVGGRLRAPSDLLLDAQQVPPRAAGLVVSGQRHLRVRLTKGLPCCVAQASESSAACP